MYGTGVPLNHYNDASPADLFGSSSYLGNKRRRNGLSLDKVLARYTTKAVLSAPFIILCLWSVAVTLFPSSRKNPLKQAVRVPVRPHHHNVMEESNPKQAVRVPARLHHNDAVGLHEMPGPKSGVTSQFTNNEFRNVKVVQPPGLELEDRELVQQNPVSQLGNVIVRPRPHPRNVLKSKHNNHNNHAKHSNGYIPIFVPLGQEQPGQNTANAMVQNQNQLFGAGAGMAGTQTQTNPMAEDSTQTDVNPMSNSQMLSSGMGFNQMMKAEPQLPIVDPLGQSQSATTKTTVYYYDASETKSGGIVPPNIVYDEFGNAIPLAQLQSSDVEIYLEPPSLGSARTPNQQTLSVAQFEQMAIEPPAQDQFIIIATVAVMALLVGALSARRLRKRQFLSSCIENESLEHEVAYDQAYTLNHGGDYSTFGNWKGDLEKFDV